MLREQSGGPEKYVVGQDICVYELKDSDEVCCRCDREVQSGGRTASRISSKPVSVCYGDGQVDMDSMDYDVCR